MAGITAHLKQMWARRDAAAEVSRDEAQAALQAPPYVRAVAVYEHTLRLVAGTGLVAVVLLGGLVAWQQVRISALVQQVRDKDYLVVPGAADFVEVRANMVPDNVIVRFVEYFTTQMVSVTDRNLERRYAALAHFMTPALEARLSQEIERKAAVLRSLHGAEVFDPLGEPQIERIVVGDRVLFEARIRGRIERYALGRALDSSVEVITVQFRTRSSLGADEPWIFEVVEFVRRTEAEQLQLEQTRRVVKQEIR